MPGETIVQGIKDFGSYQYSNIKKAVVIDNHNPVMMKIKVIELMENNGQFQANSPFVVPRSHFEKVA